MTLAVHMLRRQNVAAHDKNVRVSQRCWLLTRILMLLKGKKKREVFFLVHHHTALTGISIFYRLARELPSHSCSTAAFFFFFVLNLLLFLVFHPTSSSTPCLPDESACRSLINPRCPPLLPFPFCAPLLSSPAIFVPHQLASSFHFNIPSLSHCLRASASF